MAKANQFKSQSSDKGKKASKKTGKLKQFIQDPKTLQITGLLLLVLSAYLTIAFTSFMFTWDIDQEKLYAGWPDDSVQNWLGKLGAWVAHGFMHKGFGIVSYVFPFLSFLLGVKALFKHAILPLKRSLVFSFFGLIWVSLFFGYIIQRPDLLFLGGTIGYTISTWLIEQLGSAGTGILIFVSLTIFTLLNFDIPIEQWIRKFVDREGQSENEPSEEKIDAQGFSNVRTTYAATEPAPSNTQQAQTAPTTEPETKEPEQSLEIETAEKPDTAPKEKIEEENDTADSELELETESSSEKNDTEESEDDLELSVEEPVEKEEVLSESEIDEKVQAFGEYDPTLDLASFQLPNIDLLVEHGSGGVQVDREELEANKNRIVETLGNYNIQISKIKATIGPTVTLYEIVPAAGVRISKIKNLEDDIALSLSALGIRIIAPIPGKGTIGIEVPNQNKDIVSMRSLIASDKFQNSTMDLPVALGKTITNETFVTDLAKMPHLLMAGATGQGKSVGLNAILVSLLYKMHPAQLKFVLVDPKKVELTLFNKIERHYLAKLPDTEESIITDTSKVVATVNSLCIEMDQRYELLKTAMVRNLKEYNAKFVARKLNPEKGHRYLPYIVLVIDEFADLIMTAGKEIETPIARLAQLARAVGIHLIVATQRPSVNIITGTIKANFPSRIAFRVTSKIDSRTILDAGGADQLIGRGDMLFSNGNTITRIQCGFVDTPEVEKICDFIGEQRGYPEAFLLPEYVDESAQQSTTDDIGERDALFEDAARTVVQNQQGSASLLQRRLKLGYNRAGRIIDQLEAAGIIGPFEGSKARQVLIPDEASLEQFLNNSDQND